MYGTVEPLITSVKVNVWEKTTLPSPTKELLDPEVQHAQIILVFSDRTMQTRDYVTSHTIVENIGLAFPELKDKEVSGELEEFRIDKSLRTLAELKNYEQHFLDGHCYDSVNHNARHYCDFVIRYLTGKQNAVGQVRSRQLLLVPELLSCIIASFLSSLFLLRQPSEIYEHLAESSIWQFDKKKWPFVIAVGLYSLPWILRGLYEIVMRYFFKWRTTQNLLLNILNLTISVCGSSIGLFIYVMAFRVAIGPAIGFLPWGLAVVLRSLFLTAGSFFLTYFTRHVCRNASFPATASNWATVLIIAIFICLLLVATGYLIYLCLERESYIMGM